VQVEATFKDGTKLVTIHDPLDAGTTPVTVHPGKLELLPEDDQFAVAFNEGQTPVTLWVENISDRPIAVGSHFHFADVNEGLHFKCDANRVLHSKCDVARGMRLHIAAGTSERFEPGAARDVWLVPIAGQRTVSGLQAGKSAQEADVSR
jgi:urease subunit gamma/beta